MNDQYVTSNERQGFISASGRVDDETLKAILAATPEDHPKAETSSPTLYHQQNLRAAGAPASKDLLKAALAALAEGGRDQVNADQAAKNSAWRARTTFAGSDWEIWLVPADGRDPRRAEYVCGLDWHIGRHGDHVVLTCVWLPDVDPRSWLDQGVFTLQLRGVNELGAQARLELGPLEVHNVRAEQGAEDKVTCFVITAMTPMKD